MTSHQDIQLESLTQVQSSVLFVRSDQRTLEVGFNKLAEKLKCSIEQIVYDHPSLESPERMFKIPNLILLDAQDSRSSTAALDFLKRMRHDPRMTAIPMMVVTNPADHGVQIQLSHFGSDDFIEADAPLEVVISRVRAQLRHSLAAQRLERVAIERDLFAAGVLHDIAYTKNNIVELCQHIQGLIAKDLSGSVVEIKSNLLKLKDLGSGLGIYASDVIQSLKDGTREPKLVPMKISSILDWYRQTQLGEPKQKSASIEFHFLKSHEELEFLADQSFLKVVILNIAKIFTDLHKDEGAVIRFYVKQEQVLGTVGGHGGVKVCRNHLICERDSLKASTYDLLMNLQQGFYSDYHGIIASWALARKVVQKMDGMIWLDRKISHLDQDQKFSINIDFPLSHLALA